MSRTEWRVEHEQRLPGSAETAFSYFTDPEKYVLWQGVAAELDPRPGGLFLVHLGPNGRVRGEYVVVEPPRRLVFTWGWEGDLDAVPEGIAAVGPGASTVEIEFVPDGDGTIVRVRHSGLPIEESVDWTTWGWAHYLGRLGTVMAGEEPEADAVRAILEALRTPD